MKTPKITRRIAAVASLAAVAVAGVTAKGLIGSDHVDTAEVELSPRMDMNDVYVFPGSSADRIVLVMYVASPTNALGRNVQGLDPNALYMFKIDNDGDAREDYREDTRSVRNSRPITGSWDSSAIVQIRSSSTSSSSFRSFQIGGPPPS
jgi:hypothetical protein